MRVIISTLALAHPGGTESYCLTVARELERLGHDVTLFADELGPLADEMSEEGLDVAREFAELPRTCDAVLANDAITAGLLAERYPDARRAFCLHSTRFDVQLPPLTPGLVDAIVAPSERFAAYGRALALDVPLIRLTQPIDTEWFVPSDPPRTPPRRALLLSNYLGGRRRDALVESWTAAGIDCIQVGIRDRIAFDVRRDITEADIVVAKARAALEGMACGKAVYVFDEWGGDGWVTGENYQAFEADNFAGQATERSIDRRQLSADLERYDADMGWINRELAISHHCVRSHARELVGILRGPARTRPDSASGAAAAARTLRSAWRMQRRAAGEADEAAALRVRVGDLSPRLNASEDAVRTLTDTVRALSTERDGWRARERVLERELERSREVIATRRVRVALILGRLLDRVRRRS